MSTVSNGQSDPLAFSSIRRTIKDGVETSAEVKTAISTIACVLFTLAQFVASVPAAMVTPLLRTRIGLCTLCLHAPLGLVLLGTTAVLLDGNGMVAIIACWSLVLSIACTRHLVVALRRLFFRRADHVHRFSMGEPWPLFHRFWHRVLGRRAKRGIQVALLGEAPLLILIAIAFAIVEPVVERDGPWGAWLVPLLAAMGIASQAAIQAVKAGYRVQVLLDRELDQNELADALRFQTPGAAHREPEGFVQIPR